MAKGDTTLDERSQNLRDVQSVRPRAAEKVVLNLTHREGPASEFEEIVKRDIIRVLGNDRRLGLVGDPGAEFLLSMGLLVTDPGDRAQLLASSLPWAFVSRAK